MKNNEGMNSNPKYGLPFILAIAVHAAIIAALILVAPISSYRQESSANTQPVVHAAVIDSAQVEAQVQKIQSREAAQQAEQQQQVQKLQAQAEAARQAKAKEEQRLAQIKIDQQKAQQQQQLAAQQVQAEQQRLAQLKVQQQQQQAAQAKAQAAAQARAAAALKKQQEAAQAKALAEKKQRDLAAAKQKQAELQAQQKALQQQLMQQQIASDQQEIVKAQQMQGIIDIYRARILAAIGNQWLIPDGTDRTISCVFNLEVTPAGVVTHAQLITSSGNAALDRAAETAIYKASPLPIPKDPAVYQTFKQFKLKMTPQAIAH